VNLLLDTHIFLWWDRDPSRLPTGVEDLIANRANAITVSAISVFELAMKRERGHLKFTGTLEALIARHGFHMLPVNAQHAEAAAALPMIHRDPFDRLLIAQAQIEQLALVTTDEEIKRYAVAVF
jgi:PIN domain nuclease of toxin-antitoxin system